ncbi:MAG: class I SAM-dependent methyltransferase [Dehalococcoidia bacterium]
MDSVKGFDVIECEPCGFKHIVPVPTPEELDAVYRQEYYSREKPLYLERHREDLDWWNLVYSERYDTFEDLLPPHRRRILDIGSGPGFFLHHGKQRGWQTLGVEPSAQAAAHSRGLGLDIRELFLTEHTARDWGTFDVVHMSEVLEHIPDPRGMLHMARGLLAEEGLICVVVPNDYSPFQHALRTACGYQPWWVAPPHHINYFDFDSLARLVEKTGFEVVLSEATFPIDIFLLMGDNYVGNDALGRQCHAKRKLLDARLTAAGLSAVKRQWYQKMAEAGLGREVVLFGRKRQSTDL